MALSILGAGAGNAAPNAGAYLAARQAILDNDFLQASRHFSKGLAADPSNNFLLENAMTAYIALGQVDMALPIAQSIAAYRYESQIGNLTLIAAAIKAGDWNSVFTTLESGRSVGPLFDGLVQGWAHLGQGDMDAAIASFDAVIATNGMTVYGLTHKAYALASVGDFEGAEAIFAGPVPDGMRYSRQSAIAHAQILSQLGRNQDAVAIIDGIFGAVLDPGVAALRGQLSAGVSVPYDAVRTPQQGVAALCQVIAGLVQEDAPTPFTLMYARMSAYLWPENTTAVLLTAGLLEDLKQHDLANTVYASIAPDDPSYPAAELGRAEVLAEAGREDAAIEVLTALSRSNPDLPEVYFAQGNHLRKAKRYSEAATAYTQAIDRYDAQNADLWFAHYARGIAFHQLDRWSAAETDFRAALALRPNQPQILNYLGYSLVERGEKLDEALQMIETAAAAQPDSGAIVDSLGWVYFEVGRFEEAVAHLERAASLEPVDPVINDHLGDALWAVGREIEARFQWQRALSFGPTDEEAVRIRDKLQRGLDLVLVDEGRKPVRFASGND